MPLIESAFTLYRLDCSRSARVILGRAALRVDAGSDVDDSAKRPSKSAVASRRSMTKMTCLVPLDITYCVATALTTFKAVRFYVMRLR